MASNPDPPFVAPPNSELCPDDVLASLEVDLTMLDSLDELLVRGATDRIISRGVGLMECIPFCLPSRGHGGGRF